MRTMSFAFTSTVTPRENRSASRQNRESSGPLGGYMIGLVSKMLTKIVFFCAALRDA